MDAEDSLVLSDDAEVVKKACGRSYAPFPKGTSFMVTSIFVMVPLLLVLSNYTALLPRGHCPLGTAACLAPSHQGLT